MKKYLLEKREVIGGIQHVFLADTRRSSFIKKCSQQEIDSMVNEANEKPITPEELEQLRNMLERMGHYDLADRISGFFVKGEK